VKRARTWLKTPARYARASAPAHPSERNAAGDGDAAAVEVAQPRRERCRQRLDSAPKRGAAAPSARATRMCGAAEGDAVDEGRDEDFLH
jgi:hypothetical protein